MAKKIDRRIKYHVILDVETAGGLGNPLTYDIGYLIADKKGRIYEERSYVIKEIWEKKDLMNSAYYSEKIPMYERDIKSGKRTVISFFEFRKELFELMRLYDVKVFSAYNLKFDMRALQNTASFLVGKKVKFLTREFSHVELLCIWCFACQVLYTQKSYHDWAMDNGYFSEAGNVQTNAEVGYKYITGNHDFIESHTGLEDAKIELVILSWSYRQNKKHTKELLAHPWRLPQKK